jgi:voltage-gated potassium channel
MYNRIKQRLYAILENTIPGDHIAQAFSSGVMLLIVLNVTAIILDTVEGYHDKYGSFFFIFECFSIAMFTVEYVGRLWTCNVNPRFAGRFRGRLRYAVTFMALVDLFSILPFYLPMFVKLDLRFLRVLRLFRIFRIFKIARYSESLQTMGNVLQRKKAELLLTFSGGGMLLIIAACLMYEVEHAAQPEVFSSIPQTMWWAVVTLTTVGYGDMIPLTLLGKMLGALIAILGVGMIALPAGLLGAGFLEEIQQKRRQQKTICPHCGKEIEPQP